MSISPEIQAQRAVVAWLRRVLPAGSKVAHIPNEAKGEADSALARARYGAARRKSGVLDGVPDLVCALPHGETIWIEMKRPPYANGSKAYVRDDQAAMHVDMTAIGHRVGVATCIESARYLLHRWGIPLREAPGQPAQPAAVLIQKPRARLLSDPMPF